MTSTRLMAGAIGLALLLPLIFWGGVLAVVLIVAVALAIGVAEYAAMAFPDDRQVSYGWMLLGASSLAAASVWGTSDVVLAVGATTVLATLTFVTFRQAVPIPSAADHVGRYLLGMVWIGGLLPFLVRLRDQPDGIAWVVLAMAISWMGDTGAYFAGRALGRTPLYPRVSPKKTVEGLVGGIGSAILGVLVFRTLWLPSLDAIDVVVLGALGCGAGVVGDLCESLLKRSFGVKDSGWILPGHGGLLDRIDSLLFVAPVVWVWITMRAGGLPWAA